MAIEKLGDDPARYLKTRGNHADGKGLYLKVAAPGQGSWVVRFGTRDRCIGPADLITAKAARALHKAMREERHAGRDPWSLMSPAPVIDGTGTATASPMVAILEATGKHADGNRKRFADVVESAIPVIAANNKWNERTTEPRKYRHLQTGKLGKMWTDEIDQTHIAAECIGRWKDGTVSADKYRMRIKAVLDHATANKWRPNTPNPGAAAIMKHLLKPPPKGRPHPSMPVELVPAFMDDLLDVQDTAARALAFLLHTVARTAEARDARWEEIKGNVWHIPASRMKEGATNGDHWVPLTDAAIKLLGTPKKSGLIFGELSEHALDDKLKEVRPGMLVPVPGFPDAPPDVHGFRTSFVSWANKNGQPARLWDRAMHHASKVGGKYNGNPLTEERREMMAAWSAFLTNY